MYPSQPCLTLTVDGASQVIFGEVVYSKYYVWPAFQIGFGKRRGKYDYKTQIRSKKSLHGS